MSMKDMVLDIKIMTNIDSNAVNAKRVTKSMIYIIIYFYIS
jgi:hypothetical protein